jgi:rubredoxin
MTSDDPDWEMLELENGSEVVEGIFAPKNLATAAAPILDRAFEASRSAFYESDAWRTVRYRALKLYGTACQCCGNRASPEKPLHVDHIKPRGKYPELELEISNLQVLCRDCNLGKGAWDETDWRAK